MFNPSRRNKNIGTSKQGYGQANKLVIPYPAVEMKHFVERLEAYTTVKKIINGHTFRFVIETTRTNSFHACTVQDIEQILLHIPKEDFGDLELIILRQPTRKEENLQSVWGRLIYSYEFEDDFFPAVIVEAVDLTRTMKWSKKLDVDDQKELQRLKDDGHPLEMGKRFHEAQYRIEHIRATQLYRTIPHEFGHYVHYLEVVKRPLSKLKAELDALDKQIADNDTSESNPLYDQWNALDDNYREKIDTLEDLYHAIPSAEKEVFAHAYADKFKAEMTAKGTIPFDRILDEDELKKNGLKVSDFRA